MANRGRDIGVGVGIFVVSILAAGGVAFAVESMNEDGDEVAVGDTTSTTVPSADTSTSASVPTEETTPDGLGESDTADTIEPSETPPTSDPQDTDPPGDGAASGEVDDLVADVEAAGSCEALADEAITFVQALIGEAEGLSVADLENTGPDGEPAFIADYEPVGAALDARADELGCSEDELDVLVCERAPELTVTNTFGELFREGFVGEACPS